MDKKYKSTKMVCSLIKSKEAEKMQHELLQLVEAVISGNKMAARTLQDILKVTATAKTLKFDKTKDGWILLKDVTTGKFNPAKWKPGYIIGDTFTRLPRDGFCSYAGWLGQRHAEALAQKKPGWDIGHYTGCREVWILFPHTIWFCPHEGLMMPRVFTRNWDLDFVSATKSFNYDYTVLVPRR